MDVISFKINKQESSVPKAKRSIELPPFLEKKQVVQNDESGNINLGQSDTGLDELTRKGLYKVYDGLVSDDLEYYIAEMSFETGFQPSKEDVPMLIAFLENDETKFINLFIKSAKDKGVNAEDSNEFIQTCSDDIDTLNDFLHKFEGEFRPFMQSQGFPEIENSDRIDIWTKSLKDPMKIAEYLKPETGIELEKASSLEESSKIIMRASEEVGEQIPPVFVQEYERNKKALAAQVLFGELGNGLSPDEQAAVAKKIVNDSSHNSFTNAANIAAQTIKKMAVQKIEQRFDEAGIQLPENLKLPELKIDYQLENPGEDHIKVSEPELPKVPEPELPKVPNNPESETASNLFDEREEFGTDSSFDVQEELNPIIENSETDLWIDEETPEDRAFAGIGALEKASFMDKINFYETNRDFISSENKVKFLDMVLPEASLKKDKYLNEILSQTPNTIFYQSIREKFTFRSQGNNKINIDNYLAPSFLNKLQLLNGSDKLLTLKWLTASPEDASKAEPKALDDLSAQEKEEVYHLFREEDFALPILDSLVFSPSGIINNEYAWGNFLESSFSYEEDDFNDFNLVYLNSYFKHTPREESIITLNNLLTAKQKNNGQTDSQSSFYKSMFESSGPLYVKLGQILANNEKIKEVNSPLFEACLTLQDSANVMTYSDLFETILKSQLSGDILITQKLGFASVKGVAAAQYMDYDGEEFVIKCLRQGIDENLDEKEKIMRNIFEDIIPELKNNLGLDHVPDYIGRLFESFREEVDFTKEINNQTQLNKLIDETNIPVSFSLIDTFSSNQYLIKESKVKGIPLKEAEKNLSQKEKISNRLKSQVFE